MRYGLPVGGQALPNGVMMRSCDRTAIALRRPSGEIVTDCWTTRQRRIVKRPVLRGIVQLFSAIGSSFSAYAHAVRLAKAHGGIKPRPLSVLCLAVAAAVIALYCLMTDGFFSLLGSLPDMPYPLFYAIYGVGDLALFSLALFVISRLPPVRRLLRYHGAEHKTITCYEKRLPLESAFIMGESRFHRRCGTSMVATVILAGIIIPMLIPPSAPEAVQYAVYIVLILLVIGLNYEMMRSSRTGPLVKLGLAAQRLTTAEPDEAMTECAAAALIAAVGGNDENNAVI